MHNECGNGANPQAFTEIMGDISDGDPPLPETGACWAVFLDIDGTLLAIAPTPHAVRVRPGLTARLGRLGSRRSGAWSKCFGNCAGAPPTCSEILESAQIRRSLAAAAGHINGRFAKCDWTPLRSLNKSFNQRTLCGFMRTASIGPMTPMRPADPNDVDAMAEAKRTGLTMPIEERRERWHAMMKTLRRNDITAWRENFVRMLADRVLPVER